jgi:hypothetical protein
MRGLSLTRMAKSSFSIAIPGGTTAFALRGLRGLSPAFRTLQLAPIAIFRRTMPASILANGTLSTIASSKAPFQNHTVLPAMIKRGVGHLELGIAGLDAPAVVESDRAVGPCGDGAPRASREACE